jgi:hypothetical protein
MSEWYLVYGFQCESDLNDYIEDVTSWKDKTGSYDMDHLRGMNLGVHLLDLEILEDFDLSEAPDELQDYSYYVFWKIEAGFSVGYGFHTKEDVQSKE